MNPFVMILMALDLGAAAWEIWHKNPRMAVYWFSAFTLTWAVSKP